jgi:hypothetical protein
VLSLISKNGAQRRSLAALPYPAAAANQRDGRSENSDLKGARCCARRGPEMTQSRPVKSIRLRVAHFLANSDHENLHIVFLKRSTSCVETDNTECHVVCMNKTGGGESMRVSCGRASGNRR